MGSMPRKEEQERKARERAAAQPAVDCETSGDTSSSFPLFQRSAHL
jgi:hypothetical protein